jgi:hypothetical protein
LVRTLKINEWGKQEITMLYSIAAFQLKGTLF